MKGHKQMRQQHNPLIVAANIHNNLLGIRKQLGNKDIYVLLRVCKKSVEIHSVYINKPCCNDLGFDDDGPKDMIRWHNKNKHLRSKTLQPPMDYLG